MKTWPRKYSSPGLRLLTYLQNKTEVGVYHQLQELHYSQVLPVSEENPFPLAPRDLVRSLSVNKRNYEEEELRLEITSGEVMIPQLEQIAARPNFLSGPRVIEIFGAGLMRDLRRWIIRAVQLGFLINIRDCTEVACNNARAFIKKHSLSPWVKVFYEEVEDGWDNGSIDDKLVIAYYAGQFIQVQDPNVKDRILEHWGEVMRLRITEGIEVVAYLMHARGEDNPTTRVEFGKSITYSDGEIRVPIERGFGGTISMEPIGKHDYFAEFPSYHRYTYFRLSAPQSRCGL